MTMLNWKRFFLLILVASFLAACSTSKKVFVPVDPERAADKNLAEKGSVVYVYRPSKVANVMLTPDLSIAGVEKIAMASGMYKKVYLSPAVYAVRLHEIEGVTDAVEHDLEIIKGKVHYLRVDASMKLNAGQQSYQPYKRKFELMNVSPEKAKLELVSCKDMDVAEKRKSATTPESENAIKDDASFSVDKTQNPFSR